MARQKKQSDDAIAEFLANAMMADILRGQVGRPGLSYDGQRDLYEALGYRKTITYDDYVGAYKRQEIARAVITAPVAACWRKFPDVWESDDDEETQFEKDFKALCARLKLANRFMRLDKMASMGEYAVLLFGFNDAARGPEVSVQAAANGVSLLYAQPFSEKTATVATWVTDEHDERFGLPASYNVTLRSAGTATKQQTYHHSRMLHVAEDCLESETEGSPRLEAVFNRLENLELVAGGSAEMFWRGGFPGLALKEQFGSLNMNQTDKDALKDEILNYLHKMQRYIRLKGIDVQELTPQVADPKNHIDAIISLIAAGTRIPQRILMGSERGQLASGQDDENWLTRIQERQTQHCEPNIIRPFIDRCIEYGVLAQPKSGTYTVEWANLLEPNDSTKAETALKKSQALAAYCNAVGAQDVIAPQVFQSTILGMSDEEIALNNEALEAASAQVNDEPAVTEPQKGQGGGSV